jgi:hypothetical protein
LFFKGPGFFKTNLKIGGNVEYLKAYRLIPLTPPPPVPLDSTFNVQKILSSSTCYEGPDQSPEQHPDPQLRSEKQCWNF